MAEPREGFVVCTNCNRAWHAEEQKEWYVRLRDSEGKWFVFCTDDLNCAAVYALDHFDDRDVCNRARAQIARWKRAKRGFGR